MRLSEERISHIAHLIVDGIWGDDIVDFKDEARVLKEVKAVMFDYLHMEDEADEHARDMIHSLKKNIPEGSYEWEILYRKYYEELVKRKNF